MPRAVSIIRAAERPASPVADTLILPHAQRQVQQGFVFGVKGTCVEFDLAEPTRLYTDDAVVLDNGHTVEIVAEAEPLLEARAADLAALARLAWHLGDRHVPVEVLERRLRLRRDPALAELLRALGAKVIEIEAPFEPEGGAYARPGDAAHDHHHGHDHHHHDDHHHHHDHGHHGHHDHGHHDHAHHDHGHDHHSHDHDHDHHDHGHHHHDHPPHRDKA